MSCLLRRRYRSSLRLSYHALINTVTSPSPVHLNQCSPIHSSKVRTRALSVVSAWPRRLQSLCARGIVDNTTHNTARLEAASDVDMQPEHGTRNLATGSNSLPSVSSSINRSQAFPSGRQRAEGAPLGDNIDPALIDHNLSNVRTSFRGPSSGSAPNSPAASMRAPLAWNQGQPPAFGFSSTGAGPSTSAERSARLPDGPHGSATGSGGQDGYRSEDDSIGGDQMEDDDETRTGSYGMDDMTMTPQDTGEGGSATALENRRKRQSLRRGTACVRCRSKKLKCTGERPTCAVCANSKKPVECVYEEPPKKIPKIRRRQTRLQQIEAQIEERTNELEALQQARLNGERLTCGDVEDQIDNHRSVSQLEHLYNRRRIRHSPGCRVLFRWRRYPFPTLPPSLPFMLLAPAYLRVQLCLSCSPHLLQPKCLSTPCRTFRNWFRPHRILRIPWLAMPCKIRPSSVTKRTMV